MIEFKQAKSEDVPELVGLILALRKITAETGTATTRAQGIVFRNIPAAILLEVTGTLERLENPLAALSGR